MNKSSENYRESPGIPIWVKSVAGVVVFGLLMVAMVVGTGILNPEEESLTADNLLDLPPDQRAEIAIERNNWRMAENAFREMIEADQFDGRSLYNLGFTLHRLDRLDEALEYYEQASDFVEFKDWSFYNLACIHALQQRPDDAIEALDQSVNAGLRLPGRIEDDEDLVSLHDDPRFLQIALQQYINVRNRHRNR